MKFDLSKFRKVYSDGKSTKFKHKDGHEIIVSHTPLPKEQLSALNKLPTQAEDHEQAMEQEAVKMAEGGIAMLKERYSPRQSNPKLEESHKSPRKMYAEGTDDVTQDPYPQDAPPDSTPVTPDQQPMNVLPVATAAGQAQHEPEQEAIREAQTPPMAPSPTLQPANAPGASSGVIGDSMNPNALYPGYQQGISESKAGIEKESQAKQQQSKETASGLAGALYDRDTAMDTASDRINEIQGERSHIAKELSDQTIKPNQYLSDMSTPGKISTAIGLLLGGIGSGLAGGSNPALDFINAQIDRNIAGQQAMIHKNQNLLSANTDNLRDARAGADFTRVNYLDHVKNLIDMAAAKAGTPMAQAEALKAKGQIDMQTGMLMSKVGSQVVLNHPNATEPEVTAAVQRLRMLDPDRAKEAESRILPGVGISNVPLNDADRQKVLAHQQLDLTAKDLLQFSKQNKGSLDPRVNAAGQQKVLALQALYREGLLGTVYREGEQPLLDKIAKNPTSFFNDYTNIPKLQEVINSNAARFNTMKQSKGIRPFGGQQSQQTAVVGNGFKPRSFKPQGQ